MTFNRYCLIRLMPGISPPGHFHGDFLFGLYPLSREHLDGYQQKHTRLLLLPGEKDYKSIFFSPNPVALTEKSIFDKNSFQSVFPGADVVVERRWGLFNGGIVIFNSLSLPTWYGWTFRSWSAMLSLDIRWRWTFWQAKHRNHWICWMWIRIWAVSTTQAVECAILARFTSITSGNS